VYCILVARMVVFILQLILDRPQDWLLHPATRQMFFTLNQYLTLCWWHRHSLDRAPQHDWLQL